MRLLVLALAVSTMGCAAVFKGGHQDVRVVSYPEGATVRQSGKFVGDAPVSVSVDRDRGQTFEVTKPGYEKQYVALRKKADTPWFFWDIATCVVPVTLCIPVLVDAISGAWYSYDDEYPVKLEPVAPPPKASSPAELAPPPASL